MRQVTPQKPHRSSVSASSPSRTSISLSKTSSGDGGRGCPPQEQRTYPAAALAVVLVVGIVLGLLFAGLISAFVGGGESSSGRPDGSASPSSSSSASSDLATTQRTDEIRANSAPENRDVRVFACGVDGNGYASARVLVTNGGDDEATYAVRVIFASASDGDIISDDVAHVQHLAPGTSAPLQTVNAIDRAPDGNVVCRLGSVSRF